MASKPKSAKAKGSVSRAQKDIYEELLEFFKSPMWILPIMSFIEQRSCVFDAADGDPNLYKQIHEEFGNMVDMLIGCFCEDTNITPDDVKRAVERSTNETKAKLEQNMLEPMIAAHDLDVFVHMMLRKNIELQLQALQMIEVVYGLIPAILVSGDKDAKGLDAENENERLIMVEVIRKSKEEFENDRKKFEAERQNLEKALEDSLTEKQLLELDRKKEDQLLKKALELSLNENLPQKETKAAGNGGTEVNIKTSNEKPSPQSNSMTENTVHQKKQKSTKSTVGDKELPALKATEKRSDYPETMVTHKPSVETPGASRSQSDELSTSAQIKALLMEKQKGISPEEIEKRKMYLQQQREKLLKLKQDERQKAFNEAEKSGRNDRPRTAKASAKALKTGRGDNKVNEEMLAARKALAEKLRSEVIRL